MNTASEDSEKLAEFLEFDTGEKFSECVRNHVVDWGLGNRVK